MPEGLWWLPSLIVFGATGAVVTFIVRAARRKGTGGAAELDRASALALVRADDAVRAAEDEVLFAGAQFGEAEALPFAQASGRARARLREAFLLRQQLDDEIPDTPSQRERWNRSILSICAEVEQKLSAETSRFDALRVEERRAGDRIATLRSAAEAITASLPEAERALVALKSDFAPPAWAPVSGSAEVASVAIGRAVAALDSAERAAAMGTPVAPTLGAVAGDIVAARAALDAMTTTDRAVRAAVGELDALRTDAAVRLAAARSARDAASPSAAERITAAIVAFESAVGRGQEIVGPTDPLARIDAIRDADDRLDAALSDARSEAQRLENARGALRGALFSARSHLDTAASVVSSARAGADARTRLAEAQRQLALAEAADDPVEALDAARRSSRIAQDADALARYAMGPGGAPIRG